MLPATPTLLFYQPGSSSKRNFINISGQKSARRMLVGLVLVPEPVTLPQGGAPWSFLGPLGPPDLWWSVVRGGRSASSEARSMGPFQERCCFDRQRVGRYWSNLILLDSPWSSYGREGDLPWVRRPSVARGGHPWIRRPSCGGGGGVVPGSGGHLRWPGSPLGQVAILARFG